MTEHALDNRALLEAVASLERDMSRLRGLLRQAPAAGPRTAETGGHPYIESVPDVLGGEPIIAGTRTPVRAVVEHWKFGTPPEEIARKLPHLRLAQIFDALGYYDDHRDEIEHHLARNRVPVDD